MPVTATLWEHINFGGQSFTTHSAGFRYRYDKWAPGAFNDRFSSMRAWSSGHRGNAYAFEHINFDGRFAALNVGGGFSSAWWSYFGGDFNDVVSSSLIVTREERERETEVALRNVVVPQFGALLDARTAGTPVSRDGDPRIYATYFPPYDTQRAFLTIDQNLKVKVRIPFIPLKIKMPGIFGDIDLDTIRWSDYRANVRYDISFFVDGERRLRGQAMYFWVRVEGGVFSQRIYRELEPQLRAALPEITAALRTSLASFERRRFADVYLLPGPPPDMNQAGFKARYDDDVTLVAVRE